MSKIHAYYYPDPRHTLAVSAMCAIAWDKSWKTLDWDPVRLSSWTVSVHPLAKAMGARLTERKASQPLRQAYARYMAMDSMGEGGYLAHLDLFNGGFHHRNFQVQKSLICFDSRSDSLVWGEPTMYRQFVGVLMDALANPVAPHPWQVLLSWHGLYIHEEPGLISRTGPSLLIHKQINHE